VSTATARDGVTLHFESYGSGHPLLFIHEFGGDHRSWEPQVRYFARNYRCLVYAARGYPPSAVPADPAAYSQQAAVSDAVAVLDAAGAQVAHVVGNSMGSFAALHLAMHHPGRVSAVVAAGCGYGSHPEQQEAFRAQSEQLAQAYADTGPAAVAQWYGAGPARVQYRDKDPLGHAEHVRVLSEHDATGAANTQRGVQKARPSLYSLTGELAAIAVPVLIVAGDEDDAALEASLMLKRTIATSGLAVLPRSGHLTNLEEPALFNQLVEQFLARAEHGRWGTRA
jgi:pimeloyl-ACP methyl ester carboxylesterase